MPMVLVFVIDSVRGRVLLGLKHRGLGAANVVGLGGHIEPGETPAEAAVREVFEEAGVVLDEALLRRVGVIQFRFPASPGWDQDVAVLTTTEPIGEPAPSEEITPRWYPIDSLPYASMWDDARYWTADVLVGGVVDATVTFADDNRSVAHFDDSLLT